MSSGETESKSCRVQCDLPNASRTISGVRFGVVREGQEGAPAVLVSEPIDELQAKRFLSIPGFTLASSDWEAKDLARVDADIKATERARVEARARGQDPKVSRDLEEQRRANQAMSQELADLRKRAEEAEAKLAASSIATLEAEIRKQAEALVEAREKVATLERENAELRKLNEELVQPPKKGKTAAA